MDHSACFIGGSPAVRALRHELVHCARTDTRVLIIGEEGAGRRELARAIHGRSRRRRKPFVILTCAQAAAASGALAAERFLPDAASDFGGTLLIDPLEMMSRMDQNELMAFLEDCAESRRTLIRLPAMRRPRVIGGTTAVLHNRRAAGAFRDELYYRLNVVQLVVPSLRERREDIPELVRHALRGSHPVSPKALRWLADYGWPGNLDELRHVVATLRATVPETIEIQPKHLPESIRAGQAMLSFRAFTYLTQPRVQTEQASAAARVPTIVIEAAGHPNPLFEFAEELAYVAPAASPGRVTTSRPRFSLRVREAVERSSAALRAAWAWASHTVTALYASLEPYAPVVRRTRTPFAVGAIVGSVCAVLAPQIISRASVATPVTVATRERGSARAAAALPGTTVSGADLPVVATTGAAASPLRVIARPSSGGAGPARFVGALVVDSQPRGGRVHLNGRVVGRTPLRLPRLPVGSRAVKVDLSGYEAWSAAVRVVANETSRVTARLQRATGAQRKAALDDERLEGRTAAGR